MTNDVSRYGFFRRIGPTLAYLFKGKKPTEGYVEQRTEEQFESDYRDTKNINYTEIFAGRLTNYTLYGGTVTADDEEINKALARLMKKARKVSVWALAVGRSYLVPYITGGEVYTDIIPQSRSIVTRQRGDDILGFACLSDLRTVGNKRYARWTHYDYDPVRKIFSVENKATNFTSNGEVALSVVAEWADILPYIEFSGVEKPLFAFVDSPKDNRDTDMTQGAAITFGCKETIEELRKNHGDFFNEFDLKEAHLAVDKAMLDWDGKIPKKFISFNSSNGKVFEIYDPVLRDQSYINREDAVSKRLEKQVGTSGGILTNAETAMATATQVRRAMFDTVSMVDAIRSSFEDAIDVLCYAYEVYLGLLGRRVKPGYAVTSTWSQSYIEDDTERFNKVQQGHTSGVVSDLELRREIYPNESPEDAERALKEIEESKPDPFEYVAGPDGGDAVASFGDLGNPVPPGDAE